MKRFLAVVIASALLGLLPARAQAPDDQYVHIYTLIQEGDSLTGHGQANQALAKYLEAQTALQRFRRRYPDWNTQVVAFRLSYLEGQVAALSAKAPAPVPPAPGGALTAAAE